MADIKVISKKQFTYSYKFWDVKYMYVHVEMMGNLATFTTIINDLQKL